MREELAHRLYRLFDVHGRLLYVGITHRRVSQRLGEHHGKPWWRDVASWTEQSYPDKALALRAEATAICDEQPVHNVYQTARMPTRGRPSVLARCPVCCSLRPTMKGRLKAHWSTSRRCSGSGIIPELTPESEQESIPSHEGVKA